MITFLKFIYILFISNLLNKSVYQHGCYFIEYNNVQLNYFSEYKNYWCKYFLNNYIRIEIKNPYPKSLLPYYKLNKKS